LRIAYYARWDAGSESGVLKKITAQIKTWRAAGHEAALFALSRRRQPWEGVAGVLGGIVADHGWLTRSIHLSALVRKIEAWKPDIVYARFESHSAPLADMMRRVPTVLEVNSDDVSEYGLYLPRYQYLHHRATRRRTLSEAAGFVAMTHELASRLAEFGRPVEVISNGIDLADHPSLPARAEGPPRLVFMGAPLSTWHGIDELVSLARARPDVMIDLVGTKPDTTFPPNVTAHGLLTRQQYEPIHARADAAVGTLALHRKRMSEACPLKVREYLAMGLPAIVGYRDTDFPHPVPFMLEIPNRTGNAVEYSDAIVALCRNWRGRRVDRRSIEHIDLAAKETQRIAFLARFAKAH
jgi:hypothetical protein